MFTKNTGFFERSQARRLPEILVLVGRFLFSFGENCVAKTFCFQDYSKEVPSLLFLPIVPHTLNKNKNGDLTAVHAFKGTVYRFFTIFCSLLSANAHPLTTPAASNILEESSSYYFSLHLLRCGTGTGSDIRC